MDFDIQRNLLHPVAARFTSLMHVRPERTEIEVRSPIRRIFGLSHEDPTLTIDFSYWVPDPWTIVGLNGAKFATIAGISLTIIKSTAIATGKPTIFYNLSMGVKSDGWHTGTVPGTYPGAPPISIPLYLRLDIGDASGGLLTTFWPAPDLKCGTDYTFRDSGEFVDDIFSSIGTAHLTVEDGVLFWQC